MCHHCSVHFKNCLFIIYFCLCWVSAAAHELFLVSAGSGYSSFCCTGFSLRWLLLLQSEHGNSRAPGLNSRGSQALEQGLSSCATWASLLPGMCNPFSRASSHWDDLNHMATSEFKEGCGIWSSSVPRKKDKTYFHSVPTSIYLPCPSPLILLFHSTGSYISPSFITFACFLLAQI